MASEPAPGIDPQAVSDKEAKELQPSLLSPDFTKPGVTPNGFSINEPLPVAGPPAPESTSSVTLSNPDITPKFFEDASGDEPKEKEQTESSEDDELKEILNPGTEHFKKLRTSHSELKKTAAQLKEERDALLDKVHKYDSGEIVPDVLKQKDEEITRLSKYEKLVNLKASKEYQEKFIIPIEQTRTKLKEIFADYGVPTEELDGVVNKAFNAENNVDLNRFLQEHLGNDQLGAIETKALVVKAKEIQQAASNAEKEPAQMLANLQAETEAVMQVKEQNRKDRIVSTAKSSWLESLDEIRTEGKLVELIHREDDPEFNKAYPDQILSQAAKEYGKIVTELGLLGATDLPKPLAKALAKMVLMAHSSGVAVETRNRAMEGIDELTQNLTRHHNMLRPPIGGGVPRNGGGGPAPTKTLTPEQEAKNILSGVLAKR